tara:strand:+ start:4145 stop:5062 length:918 start_codon:yes stop_codon:yes gene_type:complete
MNNGRRNLWNQAIKWPLYSVAVIPIIISGAYTIYIYKDIKVINFIFFIIASILILFWENLTNDLFDSKTGIDKFKFHSVVNLIKDKRIIYFTAYLSLLVGLFIIYIISRSTSFNIFYLVCGCCLLGYLYQGPPFRLGYFGIGEPLCWTAFGPLAHASSLIALNPFEYYYSSIPWKESLIIGSGPSLAITLVLFCSHFHQIEEDKKFGKNSPLVIMGARRGASLVPWIIFLIYIFEFLTIINGFMPTLSFLYFISLPYAIKLVSTLNYSYKNPQVLKNCKFIAIKFQTFNGIGLIIGLLMSFIINK